MPPESTPAPRILIVDDDANMRESVNDNLEVEGYDVAQAESGAAALAAVKNQKFFDVILMDYNLTDSTGIDVIKNIRTINTDSQIIMLTAHASLDTALKAIQESVYDFLPKPVDFNYLKHRILKAIEKLRLEQKNRQLIAELSYFNQMKSKFMSMSSHDLSNSLMTLQVSFEMLSQTITPNEDQKKRMNYISTGISQIARLIEDLVDWASIEQGKFRMEPAVIAPGALIEKVIVGPQARAQARGISIGTEVAPGLPPIKADEKRIIQVLNNLLENAIRHTLSGGKVTVKASMKDGQVQFAVQDTGEGIAPAELSKIFQSFYQGGTTQGGRLGLGLSISKEIVENHKGKLWVESPGQGKGATFLFTLPVSA
jgi:signal transduction histidine kinase